VATAFFIAYTVMAIPLFMSQINWVQKRNGFGPDRDGVGAILFVPAANARDFICF